MVPVRPPPFRHRAAHPRTDRGTHAWCSTSPCMGRCRLRPSSGRGPSRTCPVRRGHRPLRRPRRRHGEISRRWQVTTSARPPRFGEARHALRGQHRRDEPLHDEREAESADDAAQHGGDHGWQRSDPARHRHTRLRPSGATPRSSIAVPGTNRVIHWPAAVASTSGNYSMSGPGRGSGAHCGSSEGCRLRTALHVSAAPAEGSGPRLEGVRRGGHRAHPDRSRHDARRRNRSRDQREMAILKAWVSAARPKVSYASIIASRS